MKKVLIVEDDDAVRSSLNLLLSEKYKVALAENGLQGLEKLKLSIVNKNTPDIILLDLVMPEMGGIEFLDQVKEIENESQIIVLTATNSVETAVKAMKSGAVNYISKPFDSYELLKLIDETALEAEEQKRQSALLNENELRREIGSVLEEAISSLKDGKKAVSKQEGFLEEEILSGDIALGKLEDKLETKLILEALEQTNYIQTKAAEKLGITRRVLKYKIDKLGLASFLKKKKETKRAWNSKKKN